MSINESSAGSTSNSPANRILTQNIAGSSTQRFNRFINPISSLSPYQNKWLIKARVISKTGIRTWSNAKGEGKLFSMDIMDESGEIRVTAFKEQCDKFFNMIEVDKMYLIEKCSLKTANKQYCTLKNDYEMTMTRDTIVQECEDRGESMPAIKYNFVPISQIATMEPDATIDVAGVCHKASELNQFTAKSSGREVKKREVTLVDSSSASVQLTLWGENAQSFPASTNPVIVLKGVRIKEFAGEKSLSLLGGSIMKLNPDIGAAHKLRGWYDNGGRDGDFSNVSTRTDYSTEWMTFHEVKEKNLGNGDRPDYFQVRALVHNVKSVNAVYKACPKLECNKKVIEQDNGMFRCEKCNADFPDFKYRLLVNMLVGDWTSNCWITVFADVAEQMLGKSSYDIGNALEFNKEEGERIFSAICFKDYLFKMRTKVEHFNDSARNKITAVTATPLNHKDYNAYLVNNIQELTGIGKN